MFTIYGQPNCVWCERAKSLLDERNLPYIYYEITDPGNRYMFGADFPGRRTVPAVMYNKQNIGGYEELREWLKRYTSN